MCSLAQPFYRSQNLEQRYKNTICNYTKEQANEFSQMHALIVLALDEKHQDFLGQVFSANNFGNARKGQFFTPYHVSKLMAQINFTDIENQLAENNFVTLAEPWWNHHSICRNIERAGLQLSTSAFCGSNRH